MRSKLNFFLNQAIASCSSLLLICWKRLGPSKFSSPKIDGNGQSLQHFMNIQIIWVIFWESQIGSIPLWYFHFTALYLYLISSLGAIWADLILSLGKYLPFHCQKDLTLVLDFKIRIRQIDLIVTTSLIGLARTQEWHLTAYYIGHRILWRRIPSFHQSIGLPTLIVEKKSLTFVSINHRRWCGKVWSRSLLLRMEDDDECGRLW